jgi:hypothetical protein
LNRSVDKPAARLPRTSTFLSGISLAIGIALSCLLIWTWWEASRWSVSISDARYSIIVRNARIALFGPPPATAGTAAARAIVALMSNADVQWTLWPDVPGNHGFVSANAEAKTGGTQEILRQFPTDAVIRPLLRALDDPNKVFAAHVALIKIAGVGDTYVNFAKPFTDVQPVATQTEMAYLDGFPILLYPHTSQKPRIDLTRWKTTRELWHKRLDVQIGSVSFEWLLAASIVAPLLRAARQYRRALARRRGLCPSCRYDLTGNVSGICPECGQDVARQGTLTTSLISSDRPKWLV